jgi:hypothetical protein
VSDNGDREQGTGGVTIVEQSRGSQREAAGAPRTPPVRADPPLVVADRPMDTETYEWNRSAERRTALLIAALAVVGTAVWALALFVSTYPLPETTSEDLLLQLAARVALLIVGTAAVNAAVRRFSRNSRRAFDARRATEAALREAEEAEQAALGGDVTSLLHLWHATQKRIQYYHDIATGHAARSFANAQRAMWAGFVLAPLFAVAAAATAAKTPAGSIIIAALGGASTAQAAYVARTFLRAQEAASAHLRVYFAQPLEFSRILAAERLLSSIEDRDVRYTTIAAIAEAIASPPVLAPEAPTAC